MTLTDQQRAEGFWGEEIPVNGVRPEWLTGRVVCDVRTGAGWCYTNDHDASESPAEVWGWQHRDGRPCILAIRLPRDHPAYREEQP